MEAGSAFGQFILNLSPLVHVSPVDGLRRRRSVLNIVTQFPRT